jgi:hypothetical protein
MMKFRRGKAVRLPRADFCLALVLSASRIEHEPDGNLWLSQAGIVCQHARQTISLQVTSKPTQAKIAERLF